MTHFVKIAFMDVAEAENQIPKKIMKFVSPNRKFFGLAFLSLALHGFVWQGHAQITLHNNNSTAIINPTTQAGMSHWDIQGQNQLNQQWFWFRLGNNPEASINTISPPVISLFAGTRGADITYTSPLFSLTTEYLMNPGGSIVGPGQIGQADISETITIQNLTGSPLDFHLFQYSDFDLAGPGNDTVSLGTDSFGRYNSASQSDGGALLAESVSVTAPSASHGEAAPFPFTINKLNNGLSDVLNDINTAGPTNVTWAFEWDLTIDPNNSVTISKDKHLEVQIVPEPSTLALVAAGLVSVRCLRRKRE